MDTLTQTKLSRAEWKSIESPVTSQEKNILGLIRDGFHNVNIRTNDTLTMMTFTKLENTVEIHLFLYQKFLKPEIMKLVEKYGTRFPSLVDFGVKENALKKIKSVDVIRIKNVESNLVENQAKMFEFTLLDLCKNMIRAISATVSPTLALTSAFPKKKTSSTSTSSTKEDPILYLYTLIQLKKYHILHLNPHLSAFCDVVIALGKQYTDLNSICQNAATYIEKNPYLLQYEDRTLFSHQKEVFSIFKGRGQGQGQGQGQSQSQDQGQETPKLVLYMAPTGTGKTLSPIGLSEKYRVLFVCVARHVGLALAKSAISLEKKVAFAFGCETASDIRLHYFSAVDYTINKRSGGIGKVDNSNGSNVEIMICDAQSYLPAMYYMMGFNPVERIVTYWDEPTITMDYLEHPLHETIHKNWQENKIPNMILSCATLPREDEISVTIQDFRETFPGAEVHTITSYDCKKSIPILNKDGYCVLPHFLFSDLGELRECAEYCEKNKTLLRYFDLSEIVRFIQFCHTTAFAEGAKGAKGAGTSSLPDYIRISGYFADISEITMNSLKLYYLELLKYLSKTLTSSDEYLNKTNCFEALEKTRCKKFDVTSSTAAPLSRTTSMQYMPTSSLPGANITKSHSDMSFLGTNANAGTTKQPEIPASIQGILLTTSDAYTLTDGPTIFLAEDIERIATFYMKMSKIPEGMLQNISQTILQNDKLLKEIDALDAAVEKKLQVKDNSDKALGESKGGGREKKNWDPETEALMEKINQLRKKIQMVNMDPAYIPNTVPHQKVWTPTKTVHENAFMPSVDEETVREIMMLEVDRTFKVLVLLGIGVLIKQECLAYEEIVKRLAHDQRLFIILASSDYIYGTNYQFCHGVVGKDLTNMTPQKTLQAMGRIGRNNIQQEYTVRFRDDDMIRGLFSCPLENREAVMMERLFSRD